MDEIFLKLALTTVYGRCAGDPSRPLVLGIHGWSQRNGWQTWEPFLAPLAAAGYFAVAVDMPGWGQSPAMDALPLTGERGVAVVLEILAGLQKATAVLLGKSWGGRLALLTAQQHPARISRLILTAPAVPVTQAHTFSAFQQPVLLAWAEDDAVIPISVGETLAAALPHSELVRYPTGGHSAAQNNVVDFAPRAIKFLAAPEEIDR